MVQWTVFLISYWGDQIGQKVKKICDWWVNPCIRFCFFIAVSVEPVEYLLISRPHSFRTQTFAYPESTAEREEILQGLQGRIEDIKSVSVVHLYKGTEQCLFNIDAITFTFTSVMSVSHLKLLGSPKIAVMYKTCCLSTQSHFPLFQVLAQTEAFLQQLLMRAVAVLPQWKVRVQKCKAVQMVLNLCSPSVTDKCLIAEAWCPIAKLPELQSALREGGVRRRRTAEA